MVENLINPYGAGYIFNCVLMVMTVSFWVIAVRRPTPFLGICTTVMATHAIACIVFAFVLPYTLRPDATAMPSGDYLTMVGVAGTLGFMSLGVIVADCAGGVRLIRMRNHTRLVPWRSPLVILSMTVVLAANGMLQIFFTLQETYGEWSAQGARGEVEWSVEMFAVWPALTLLGLVATAVEYILAGRAQPEVWAKWGRRINDALEMLAYSGWSQMPFAAPYPPELPSWLKKKLEKKDDTED